MAFPKPAIIAAAEKRLKEIYDFLSDTSIKHFTMRVVLHRRDDDEPLELTMVGKRATDGSWEPIFPGKGTNRTSKSAIAAAFKEIGTAIANYVQDNKLDAPWAKELKAFNARRANGLTAYQLDDELGGKAYFGNGYKAHLYAPLIATAYVINGTEAMKGGNLELASHCADKGLHWCSPRTLIKNPGGRFTERAATGGRGKANLHEGVKKKVAEFLNAKPHQGWNSKREAIDTVVLYLDENQSDLVNLSGLTFESLPRTISGWISKNPERFGFQKKKPT